MKVMDHQDRKTSSFPRKRESIRRVIGGAVWIPACAGMTCSGWRVILPLLAWLALALSPSLSLAAQARVKVALSEARFEGLTRIVARSSVPLAGIGARDVRVRRPDGGVVEADDIQGVVADGRTLTIDLRARVFARVG